MITLILMIIIIFLITTKNLIMSIHNDHATHRPHVAVVARPTPLGVIHSLVFPELVEGTYELYRRPAGPVELIVTIRGGAVTEAAWLA
jgi:hypothetical protein